MAMLDDYFLKTYIRQLIFTADGLHRYVIYSIFLRQSVDFLYYEDILAFSERILMFPITSFS